MQTERVVGKDNTVAIRERLWQIDKTRFRYSLAGTTVTIHEHLDGTVSIRYGQAGVPILLQSFVPPAHRPVRHPRISAADHHVIFLAIAFSKTSCTFIIRSISAAEYCWVSSTTQHRSRRTKRTDHV